MKKLILSILLFSVLHLNAQWGSFYINPSTKTQPCIYDSTVTINAYQSLDIYQTSNNKVDGPRDSVCFTLANNNLQLDMIDLNRPLFFRLKSNADIGDTLLLSNGLYTLSYSFGAQEGGFLKPTDCANGGCSKLVVVTREKWAGTGQDTIRSSEFYGDIVHNQCILEDNICFPTSNWYHIVLIDLWWEVYLNPDIAITSKSFVGFNGASSHPQDLVNKITALKPVTLPVINNQVEINPGHLVSNIFGPNFLFVHSLPGIPSNQNRDDKKIVLSPNPSEVVDITLKLVYEDFYFQEFTSIGPSKVEGNDILYHRLNILQDGGDMCMESIDLAIGDGTSFRYKKGNIEFSDKSACIFFKKGSTFEILPGSKLVYGHKTMGMLGWADATIKLNEASTLIFDGTLLLNGQNNKGSTVELKHNARLVFGDHASVKTLGDSDEKVRVKAFTYQIDWGSLSAEERSHFILETPLVAETTDMHLYPNPASSEIFIDSRLAGQNFSILDLYGKVYLKGICSLEAIDVSNLHSGLYILQTENSSQKWFKL